MDHCDCGRDHEHGPRHGGQRTGLVRPRDSGHSRRHEAGERARKDSAWPSHENLEAELELEASSQRSLEAGLDAVVALRRQNRPLEELGRVARVLDLGVLEVREVTARNGSGVLERVHLVDANDGLGVRHVDDACRDLDFQVARQRVRVGGREVPTVVGLDAAAGTTRDDVDRERTGVPVVAAAQRDRVARLEAEAGAQRQAAGLAQVERVEAVDFGPVRGVERQRSEAVANELGDVELDRGAQVDGAGDRVDEAVVVTDEAAEGVAPDEQPVLREALLRLEGERVEVTNGAVEVADLAERIGEELTALELASDLVAVFAVHGQAVEFLLQGHTFGLLRTDVVAGDRVARVGDDEVQTAVGRDVLDRATEVGVQPANAEHEVLDDLLLVAHLELLVVLPAQPRHHSTLGETGGERVKVLRSTRWAGPGRSRRGKLWLLTLAGRPLTVRLAGRFVGR